MASESRISGIDLYAPYLRRWEVAAAFWLLFWWAAAVGGALATAFIAGEASFLREPGPHDQFTKARPFFAWFAVGASLVTGMVKPWRFHRGYQRAAYKLQAALDKARRNPNLEARLPAIVDECHALILGAGRDLDALDGVVDHKDHKPDGDEDTHVDVAKNPSKP